MDGLSDVVSDGKLHGRHPDVEVGRSGRMWWRANLPSGFVFGQAVGNQDRCSVCLVVKVFAHLRFPVGFGVRLRVHFEQRLFLLPTGDPQPLHRCVLRGNEGLLLFARGGEGRLAGLPGQSV